MSDESTNDRPTNDRFDEMMRRAELDERLARLSARADRTRPDSSVNPREPRPTGRRSAARGSRRAALGLSAVSTLGLAGWMWSATAPSTDLVSASSIDTTTSAATATTDTTISTPSTTKSRAATTSTTVANSGSTGSASSSTLADGTYTGSSSATRWGPVQVQIVVSNGKITTVNVLAAPDSDRKSSSINARAVPTLTSATLTAQSAKISSVSGATYTSASYKTSLQSAIDAARAAS